MGFRTTMTTGDWCLNIPNEFLDKYPYIRAFRNEENGTYHLPLSLNTEIKFYSSFEETEMFKDIQKLMVEQDVEDIDLVLLHECGGITKVIIYKDKILGMEPTEWKNVDSVEHNYCYGCNDNVINCICGQCI